MNTRNIPHISTWNQNIALYTVRNSNLNFFYMEKFITLSVILKKYICILNLLNFNQNVQKYVLISCCSILIWSTWWFWIWNQFLFWFTYEIYVDITCSSYIYSSNSITTWIRTKFSDEFVEFPICKKIGKKSKIQLWRIKSEEDCESAVWKLCFPWNAFKNTQALHEKSYYMKVIT